MSNFWPRLASSDPVTRFAVLTHLQQNLSLIRAPAVRDGSACLSSQLQSVFQGKLPDVDLGLLQNILGNAPEQSATVRFLRQTRVYPSAHDFLAGVRERQSDVSVGNDRDPLQSHRTFLHMRSILNPTRSLPPPRRVDIDFEKTNLGVSSDADLEHSLEIIFGRKIPARDFKLFFSTGVPGFSVDCVKISRTGTVVAIASDVSDASGQKVAEYSRFIEITSENPQQWNATGGWISCKQKRSGFSRDHLQRYLSFLLCWGLIHF